MKRIRIALEPLHTLSSSLLLVHYKYHVTFEESKLSTKCFITWTNTLDQLTLVEVYFKWWCLDGSIGWNIVEDYDDICWDMAEDCNDGTVPSNLCTNLMQACCLHMDRIFNLKSDAEKWACVSRAEDNFVWCIILYILQYNTFIYVDDNMIWRSEPRKIQNFCIYVDVHNVVFPM